MHVVAPVVEVRRLLYRHTPVKSCFSDAIRDG